MSHSTIAHGVKYRLSLIHNGDHSGPSMLVLIRQKDGKLIAEMEVPEGYLVADLALTLAAKQLTKLRDNGDY